MLETVTMLISFRLYLHFSRDGKIVVVSYHSLHLQQLNPVFTLILFSARRTTWMLKTRKLLDGFKLSRQHFFFLRTSRITQLEAEMLFLFDLSQQFSWLNNLQVLNFGLSLRLHIFRFIIRSIMSSISAYPEKGDGEEEICLRRLIKMLTRSISICAVW